jgi:exodeoxyribonuclease VII small subunit
MKTRKRVDPMGKQDPSFEQLFQELEATVQKLEAGNLALDESLTLYERGMQLAKQCNDQLDSAELRIRELSPLVDIPLAPDDEDAPEEGEED